MTILKIMSGARDGNEELQQTAFASEAASTMERKRKAEEYVNEMAAQKRLAGGKKYS